MKFTYNPIFIKGNETIFYVYLGVLAVIILLTIFFVIRSVRKNANK